MAWANVRTSDAPGRHGEGRTAARVLVDLVALAGNYRAIGSATAAEVAGVVKADGYGLGVSDIARALYEAGCRTFFTAFGHEAVELRRILDDVEIFVLMPRAGGEAHLLHEHRLIPCLFDLDGVDRWIGSAAAHGAPGRAALHVETGIHRLGLGREELDTLLGDRSRRSRLDVALLMSHLACADEPSAPANRRQLDRFRAVRGAFPAAARQSCEFRGDVSRIGLPLRSGTARNCAVRPRPPHYAHTTPRVRPVATLEARLGQIATVEPGESVGYGGVATCDGARRIGVVLAGYADGIPRALYRPGRRFEVVVAGYRAPLFGTVSMDMVTIDLSSVPEDAVGVGAWVEIFGPNAPHRTGRGAGGDDPLRDPHRHRTEGRAHPRPNVTPGFGPRPLGWPTSSRSARHGDATITCLSRAIPRKTTSS